MSVAQINALLEQCRTKRTPSKRQLTKLRKLVEKVGRWPLTETGSKEIERARKYLRSFPS